MASKRNQIIDLIEQGRIPAEKINDALAVTKVFPEGREWLRFIDQLLLWLGGMAISFAAMFFIAYNWDDLGRFAKFGMVEVLIIFAILAYWKLDVHTVGAKVTLLMATIFLGVLLALYGQTYQTGADPWQLFFNWALLMLPWAIIGRFPAIWVLWVALINLSIVLYSMTFRSSIWFMFDSDVGTLWLLFAFNTIALATWELLSNKWQWLAERWAVRLLAIAGGVSITWLAIFAIFDRHMSMLPGVVWPIWMVCMYFIYRKIRPDLFMLAGAALSGIVVTTCFFAKHLLKNGDAGAFLFIALIVIGMGAGAAIWLRNIHREFQS